MKKSSLLVCLFAICSSAAFSGAQVCPAGQSDLMQYFVASSANRHGHFMSGSANPIYTEVVPDQDFAPSGYWFWLKGLSAKGFDVKSFDKVFVYMRSTELNWQTYDFKRFVDDLPIAFRCVPAGQPGPQIRLLPSATAFTYYSNCSPYKTSSLGAVVNDIDAPVWMKTGGNTGNVQTRVLHYRYNCQDPSKPNSCTDEEQFFLGRDIGLWQWKHLKGGSVVKTSPMPNLTSGLAGNIPQCRNSYQ